MSIGTKNRPPAPPPDDADLLKLEEVGYLLGRISGRSVRRLIDRGQLKAVRVTVGGSLRIRRDEVRRYVRDAEFAERPEAESAPESAGESAARRQASKARVKADWNTGEDPFEAAPKRKGRGVKG